MVEKSPNMQTPGWMPRRRKFLRCIGLPLQGSNLDSSDPESDVLPVTPRGSDSYSLESYWSVSSGAITLAYGRKSWKTIT